MNRWHPNMAVARKCDCQLSDKCEYYRERRDDLGNISKICTFYVNIGMREMNAEKVQQCPIKMY